MCGIGGVVGEPHVEPALLRRMAAAMAQRGPDGEGCWSGPDVGFAHRRLAIIDLDARSDQPMHLGDLHLTFNGEIYNYLELRADLEARGHRFRTQGDAEVLLHGWAEWGGGALDRFNGMFAFAIWDSRDRSLTLASDPFGEKPLFYWADGRRLVFASDIRALLEHPAVPSTADEGTIAGFLARGGPRGEPARTFFAAVKRLPAAHVLHWRDGRTRLTRYWRPAAVEVPRDYPAAVARYRELLADSVRLRLRSDVPVGTSLSGGLDSSAIVALLGDLEGLRPRHAFTARFPGYERDEWPYAAAVALRARVAHHHAVVPSGGELLRDLDRFVADHQEPVGSCSVYAQWRVMQAARARGVTVLLDGQGNDEILGGYGDAPGFALRARGPRQLVAGLVREPAQARPVIRATSADHLPMVLRLGYLRRGATPYATRDVAVTGARLAARPPVRRRGEDPFRRYLLREAFDTGLPVLLLYADRSSMAHSREVRLPFLDRRVAEYSLSLPPAFSYEAGRSKRILRDALTPSIPPAVARRRDKVGFEPPQKRWLEEPAVADRIAEVLLDASARRRGLYDAAPVEADHRRGRWRDPAGIWRAFNVELWLRNLEDARPARRSGGPSRPPRL
jgi:asparagine synthase (glutamine-hydrolysing)